MDKLTRAPDAIKKHNESLKHLCDASLEALIPRQIIAIHHQTGNPGVRWTWYFAHWVSPSVSKNAVRTMVEKYKACQSIHISSVHWQRGWLDVIDTWSILCMDITYYRGKHFLALIDFDLICSLVTITLTRLHSPIGGDIF